jgi:hypothetical protein
MADQLITRAELASWLQVVDVDNAAADLAINAATAVVQAATGQVLVQVTGDVVVLPATWDVWLPLPEAPVNAVTTVLIGVTTVTDYTAVPDPRTGRSRLWRGYGWRSYAYSTSTSFLTPPLVTVTYSHGYAVGARRLEPARDYCFRLAAFRYSNPGAAESLAIDDYRVSYGDGEPLRSLTAGDRLELRRAYGPVAGSTTLGSVLLG